MAGPLSSGDIVENYPYLWRRQALAGETEGRKFRPVCVALTVAHAKGLTHLALLPISGQAPIADQRALELPPLELRRIGFDTGKPLWLYVSEYNYDILEKSFYLEPDPAPKRRLSASFMKKVLLEFRATLRKAAGRVDRR